MSEKFVYVVPEDVKNGVQQEFLNGEWEIHGPTIEFEEISGRKSEVNIEEFATSIFQDRVVSEKQLYNHLLTRIHKFSFYFFPSPSLRWIVSSRF